MTEEEYLKQRLDHQIDWYDRKSIWHQNWYKKLKAAEIVLAASVPILVPLINNYDFIKYIIAMAGASVAVISGIQALNNFQENWIEYRSVCEALRHEKFLYLTKTGVYSAIENPFNIFVERVESIISHENINWSQINRCPTNETNT